MGALHTRRVNYLLPSTDDPSVPSPLSGAKFGSGPRQDVVARRGNLDVSCPDGPLRLSPETGIRGQSFGNAPGRHTVHDKSRDGTPSARICAPGCVCLRSL